MATVYSWMCQPDEIKYGGHVTGRVSIVQNGGADQTINSFFRFYPKIEMIQILLFF
jgi:hypothetical protein